MPSFWNWLCFPRNSFTSGKTRRHQRRRPNKENIVTLQKRKLRDDASHFQKVQLMSDRGDTHNSNNHQQNVVPNKRRRVQDIFSSESQDSVQTQLNEELLSSDLQTRHDNLTHMNVPSLFYKKDNNCSRPHCDNVESMYGYVPRAMQHVYTSTALEGQKMEDYFSNLHNDIYFSKFANSDLTTKDKSGNILQILPFKRVPSAASCQEERVSLIEESDDRMDEGQCSDIRYNEWRNSIPTRRDYNMEASFDSMLNSADEVLY